MVERRDTRSRIVSWSLRVEDRSFEALVCVVVPLQILAEPSVNVVIHGTALVWSGRASVHTFVVCQTWMVAHHFVVGFFEVENLAATLLEEVSANLVDAGGAGAVGFRVAGCSLL